MINVICLKHGTKFGPEYVNNLFNMVSRHLSLPHKFYCFTEDPAGLNPNINVVALPIGKFKGWWWKPYIFKKNHFADGDVNFYIDLDMVIVSNIDKLLTYQPENFLGLRDPGRVWRKDYQMLGSAIMRWPANQYTNIWDELDKNPGLTTKFHGDQNYIYNLYKDKIVFYPDEWIKSYKWEVRSRTELRVDSSGFKEVKNPTVTTDTVILAFHGKPMVHNVQDPIIVDNWR